TLCTVIIGGVSCYINGCQNLSMPCNCWDLGWFRSGLVGVVVLGCYSLQADCPSATNASSRPRVPGLCCFCHWRPSEACSNFFALSASASCPMSGNRH